FLCLHIFHRFRSSVGHPVSFSTPDWHLAAALCLPVLYSESRKSGQYLVPAGRQPLFSNNEIHPPHISLHPLPFYPAYPPRPSWKFSVACYPLTIDTAALQVMYCKHHKARYLLQLLHLNSRCNTFGSQQARTGNGKCLFQPAHV